ncbi:hypothetical protein FF1_000657 [Malus domestica]
MTTFCRYKAAPIIAKNPAVATDSPVHIPSTVDIQFQVARWRCEPLFGGRRMPVGGEMALGREVNSCHQWRLRATVTLGESEEPDHSLCFERPRSADRPADHEKSIKGPRWEIIDSIHSPSKW